MEDVEFIANLRLSRPSFAKLCSQLFPLIACALLYEEVRVLFETRTK